MAKMQPFATTPENDPYGSHLERKRTTMRTRESARQVVLYFQIAVPTNSTCSPQAFTFVLLPESGARYFFPLFLVFEVCAGGIKDGVGASQRAPGGDRGTEGH